MFKSAICASVLGLAVTILLVPTVFARNSQPREKPAQIVVWHGDVQQKKVALTFDDGPHPEYTAQILDILAAQNVKATFFVSGFRVEKYPELARRIVAEGHVIGNHGYSHHELKLLSRKRVQDEIQRGQAAIQEATGESTRLFRPAYGMYSRAVLAELRNSGHLLIQWSVSPKDWAHPRESVIVHRILKRVRNGSIVLLHDSHPFKESGKRDQTVQALPVLIQALQERGYQIVTVSEILNSNAAAIASSDAVANDFTPYETVLR